ncbi:hypothetical protein MINTM025_40900 [Mycobacterium intracellulare]|nr:hypothetical protein MINTM025_40900 [Mycobacterium intracellulare]
MTNPQDPYWQNPLSYDPLGRVPPIEPVEPIEPPAEPPVIPPPPRRTARPSTPSRRCHWCSRSCSRPPERFWGTSDWRGSGAPANSAATAPWSG